MTPSFLDELLGAIEEFEATHDGKIEVVFLHPPTRLSSKFAAVGRARGYDVAETEENRWVLTTAA